MNGSARLNSVTEGHSVNSQIARPAAKKSRFSKGPWYNSLMTAESVEKRSFEARLECHYLLHSPARISDRTLLVITLHGYGSNPEVMLRLTKTMLGMNHVIASLQAPSQFFPSNSPDGTVGYCWASPAHPQSSVRLHHEMLLHVAGEVGSRFGIGAERRLLVGFSQPVGLNYRFAASYPSEVRGVIGICGGMPKNWEDGPYSQVSAGLLHIARRDDELFAPAVTEKYAGRLRLRAEDVEFHLLDGGHRFPSKAGPIVEKWLERVFFV
jgi:predicted esterase